MQLRHHLRSLLLHFGVWIDFTTPRDDVRSFIHELRPLQPSTPMRRVGKIGDGGYVLPNDLEGITALISPGVSDETSFDTEIASMGIPVYM